MDILRRFLNVVDARGVEQLSLLAVAKEIGTSRRMLTAICAEYLGTNPRRFILDHRLRLARRALIAGANVTEAATLVGFYQPSRFARYYIRLFGERPRDTKRKVRR